MRDVQIDKIPLDRLGKLLGPGRAERMERTADHARTLFEGRTVWNVNATATGGGVAEMLQALLAYARGAGVDTQWLVLDGNPEFFALTKRIHNRIHGSPGDGGDLGDAERELYERTLAPNLAALLERVRTTDVVLLHDPQTAGLVPGLREAGVPVVWRSHIGIDTPDELSTSAWDFLRPYVEDADGVIFSRRAYVPAWVEQRRLWIIPPSIDPFSPKNRELPDCDVDAALAHTGLVELPEDEGCLDFVRRDGTPGTVRRHSGLDATGGTVPAHARIVLQVSRWDRLKDMAGVLRGFADHLDQLPEDAHLMLVGPDVSGVSDDPEGAEVLAECLDIWEQLPASAQARTHLVCLPMDDTDENAHLVNALQHRAAVVVQKSLVEGFGLTVTEPMWKGRAVVASRVGGIQDQIEHGTSGLLLDDPRDLDELGRRLAEVLGDADFAAVLGSGAKERVRDQFLGDRHLIQYVDLFASVLAG